MLGCCCGRKGDTKNHRPSPSSTPATLGPPFQPPSQNWQGAGYFMPYSTMGVEPYGNVDRCMRALAGGAEGFGHSAIGGLNGEIYHVTSLAGTLLLCLLVELKRLHSQPHNLNFLKFSKDGVNDFNFSGKKQVL